MKAMTGNPAATMAAAMLARSTPSPRGRSSGHTSMPMAAARRIAQIATKAVTGGPAPRRAPRGLRGPQEPGARRDGRLHQHEIAVAVGHERVDVGIALARTNHLLDFAPEVC